MKLARLNDEGKILELFDPIGLEGKLHKDLIAKLVEVADGTQLGWYKFGDVIVEPRPSSDHIFNNGKWELPPDQNATEKAAKAELANMDVSKLATFTDLRNAMKKIIEAMGLQK